jgi:diacylglycerol kinase family enzyme
MDDDRSPGRRSPSARSEEVEMPVSNDLRVRLGWQAAPPVRRPVLFVNPRSGGGSARRARIAEHARERGIEPVVLKPGGNLSKLVGEAVARGTDALGMAGGDGSLAVVAEAARRHGLPFVCIPAGTRNHFAADLGIRRRDPIGALDAFTDGAERRIDVGEVNGRTFLNNVCLGVYGDAVRQRAYRDAKLRTLLKAADKVHTSTAEAPALSLVDDRGREHVHPAVVIVSNNPYAPDPPGPGLRPALDGGRLGIIVVDAPGTGPGGPGRAWTAPSLEMLAKAPVHAGVDGEAVDLDPPLRFAIKPAALRVRISSRHAAGGRSPRPGRQPRR